MKETSIKPEIVRRFLLGDLPEAERAALEDRFLDDAEVFEQMEDAENDLVDDYVGDRLGASERRLFESFYLAVAENRAKVETARFLRRERQNDKTEIVNAAVAESRTEKSVGFWQSIRNFFAAGAFVPAAGFAVLLFIAAGLWFAFRAQPGNDIVFTPTPAPTNMPVPPTPAPSPETNDKPAANTDQVQPTASPTIQRNSNAAPGETPPRAEPREKPQPTPPRISPPAPTTVTLALVAGLVRGEGQANKLVLPKNAGRVSLTFDLPAGKYKETEARIETVTGEKIWSGKIKQTGGRAAINLPAGLFGDEDYLLIVSGAGEDGERRDFSQIYFNSERK